VYGPGDRALLPVFRYARRGVLPLVGEGDAAYTFMYIDDAVRAILAAVDRGPGGDVLFLGHEHPVTPRHLLQTVRAAAGGSSILVRIPRVLTRAGAALGDVAGAVTGRPATINSRRFVELYSPGFVCRVDRMRERLGVEAEVGIDEGVRRAARWYREQAWL
jgi:nucleoside-diphosphate-sugar epimerase